MTNNPYQNNPYTWNAHSMQVGVANCDPDITDQCIMWLWNEIQRLGWDSNNSSVPGEVRAFALKAAPSGWLAADGTAILRSSYSNLDAGVYCGDTLNGTADWGYRCTSPSNPSGSRSTTGSYIVLPDCRGRMIRALDLSKGLDPNRSMYTYQADSTAVPKQTTSQHLNGDGTVGAMVNVPTPAGSHHGFVRVYKTGDSSVVASTSTTSANRMDVLNACLGDSETRPVNIAMLICIKT